MINGYYVIKSGNTFIASSKNVITTSGLNTINQFLAGAIPTWSNYIAIGVLSSKSSASITDTDLEYEIGRYQVDLRSFQTVSGSNQLIFKTNLPPTLAASITEIGLFARNKSTKDHYFITDFSEQISGSSTWSNASVAYSSKYGTSNVNQYSSNGFISNNLSFNVAGYSANDYANLLVYSPTAISASFQIRFSDTSSNNWYTGSGMTSISSGSWSSIKIQFLNQPSSNFNYNVNSMSISFRTNTAASVTFDALKLISGDTKATIDQIVSRTVLSNVIEKEYGKPMQIEYYMQVT